MSAAYILKELEASGVKVLAESGRLRIKGRITDEQRKTLKAAKAAILMHLGSLRGDQGRYDISESELQAAAADDWNWIKDSPKAIDSLAYCVHTTKLIRAGEMPPDYTARTCCASCGDVPIFEGCSPNIDGCPWCFARGK